MGPWQRDLQDNLAAPQPSELPLLLCPMYHVQLPSQNALCPYTQWPLNPPHLHLCFWMFFIHCGLLWAAPGSGSRLLDSQSCRNVTKKKCWCKGLWVKAKLWQKSIQSGKKGDAEEVTLFKSYLIYLRSCKCGLGWDLAKMGEEWEWPQEWQSTTNWKTDDT